MLVADGEASTKRGVALNLRGVTQTKHGALHWLAAAPCEFTLWIEGTRGMVRLGRIHVSGYGQCLGAVMPCEKPVGAVIGPYATVDELIDVMFTRWRESTGESEVRP